MAPRVPSVAIIGGGHNALTAAAYLSAAGCAVTLLERLPHLGGAAISAEAFPGTGVRLSRYSYLVSLLPRQIITDLGLELRLVRRRYASYTPVPGTDTGLLIDNADPDSTRASFAGIGAAADATGFAEFGARSGRVGRALFPTMTEPLPTRALARERLGDEWEAFVEQPIAELIASSVSHDVVRGVLATDALIGTFASLDDGDLQPNVCLLYHVIGGGTGDWDVPVGGMGSVSAGLVAAAKRGGATLITAADVVSVTPDGEVRYRRRDEERVLHADVVLSGVAPATLAGLLDEPAARPMGAQVKVNLLLDRLPRLRQSGLRPEAAFGGTFHVNESWGQLQEAYIRAHAGALPDPLPCEIYCHSLADASILGGRDAHTITVFGLQVPDSLVDVHGNQHLRDAAERAVLTSLNAVLGEPIEPLLATDGNGEPCIEVRTTRDLEQSLNMPGGQIFHGPLAWPWAEPDEPLNTPAQRWGVATQHDRILLCGAGARRGGGVSGLGGHNAAMAVLEAAGLKGA